jgi:DNA end-binding protein Ku
MRAFWSGDIQFALISIPVKLYSAHKDITPHFHQIHKPCKHRISQVKRCEHCNIVDVPWGDVGKGYEVAKGEYALFTSEELKALDEDANDKGVIDILHTIEPAEVDLALVDKSYWLGPGAKRARGYELLRKTLDETGLLALAKVRLRTRPRLCVLRPHERLLSLTMLHYAAEMIDPKELAPPVLELGEKEQGLAKELMTGMCDEFNIGKYSDDQGALLLEAVDAKVKNGEVSGGINTPPTEVAKPIDLSELLNRSITEGKNRWQPPKDSKKVSPLAG